MGYRKNKTSEPGYRYAREREKYLKLTPHERHGVRLMMERYWSDVGCNRPTNKNMVACPSEHGIAQALEKDRDHG